MKLDILQQSCTRTVFTPLGKPSAIVLYPLLSALRSHVNRCLLDKKVHFEVPSPFALISVFREQHILTPIKCKQMKFLNMQKETCAIMEEKGKRRRMSKKQKAEIVLALLRGESIEELSRNNNVAVYEVAQWRDSFMEEGSKGLTKRTRSNGREAELERIIGRQQMEIELLKKKTKGFGRTSVNM